MDLLLDETKVRARRCLGARLATEPAMQPDPLDRPMRVAVAGRASADAAVAAHPVVLVGLLVVPAITFLNRAAMHVPSLALTAADRLDAYCVGAFDT